jgi:tetratricopeptide (TPR) repeat protein
LAVSALLLGASLFFARGAGWSGASVQGSFIRDLRAFDALLAEKPETAAPRLNALLDRLEKKALAAETRLSTLKRRRNLALTPGPNQALFHSAYREAAEKAAAAFPYSEPLAVLAADALLLEYPGGFSPEIEARLRSYAGLLTGNRFLSPALAVSVLAGDLSDPAAALALSRGGELLYAAFSALDGAEREDFLVNAALRSIIAGDSVAANSLLVTLLGSEAVSPRALRFGADYFYDTNPLRAADIFSRFSDPVSLGRLADSLALAGFREGAVELWTVLASPRSAEPPVPTDLLATDLLATDLLATDLLVTDLLATDLLVRSLYNLAAASTEEQAKFSYYGELFAHAPGHVYGIIAYSRLLDTARAEGLLAGQGALDPLLDLELLRRRLEGWEISRAVAETWLLLGRHPGDAELYRWGAWHFDRHRRFSETALLLRQARLNGVDRADFALHHAFQLILEGQLGEAETLLAERGRNTTAWQIPANLGLIMESRRSLSDALDQYERAAALAEAPLSEAKVRLRIARCLRMLGRTQESREALERVLELDSGNLNARLELGRLPHPDP